MPLGIRREWGSRLLVSGKVQSSASFSMEEVFNNCLRNEVILPGGHKVEKPKEDQDQCFLEAENTAGQPVANSKGSAEADLVTASESMFLS